MVWGAVVFRGLSGVARMVWSFAQFHYFDDWEDAEVDEGSPFDEVE